MNPITIKTECAYDEMVQIEKLVPHPRNPNKHPEKQIKLLTKIIAGQGWRNPIVVSNRSGFITKGHARLEAAKILECDSVPVDFQDYENEAAEYADMIADNRIAELAEPSLPEIKDLLEELDTGDFDMDLTGFDEKEIEDLMSQFYQDDNISVDVAHKTLAERFIVPPFSVLDARQGYWQDRKRAWLALGIRSELGRGGANTSCCASYDRGAKLLS